MTTTAQIVAAGACVTLAGIASWTLRPAWRPYALIAGGAGALASLSWISCLCLALATFATYRIANLRRGRVLAVSTAIAVLAGGYFVMLWRTQPEADDVALRVLLPVGMAYYVLRLVHYLIEADRDRFRAHDLVDYAAYQFFPATLLVGPIHRFDDFLRDLRRRRWSNETASWGFSRILGGTVAVVLIGHLLVNQKLAKALLDASQGSAFWSTYCETLIYWLKLYVLFSGYSSIAIGVGALLGFRIPENFNLPFLARNIGDFWRRWHLTLSSWCRDYVFTPVLAATRSPFAAFAGSMLVLGLWHAVSLHYLIWGLYHATGLTIWRRFDAFYSGVAPRLPTAVRQGWSLTARILTLHFVMFSYPFANAVEKLVLSR